MEKYWHSKTIPLPISTRGIGFAIRILVQHISGLCVYNEDDNKSLILYELTNALYRVTLLQLGVKLSEIAFLNDGSFLSFLDDKLEKEMETVKWVYSFKILTDLISAVGYFKKGAKAYVPGIPKVREEASLNPLFIHFGVLGQMVRELSDENTDYSSRNFFYEHNPIPGAKWEKCKNNQGYILTNADDIIPLNYNVENVVKDIDLIRNAIRRVERSHPHLIAAGRINYEAHGSCAQLISSKILPVRCVNFSEDKTITVSSGEQHFWSSENLGRDGNAYLLGEIDNDGMWLLDSKCQSVREKESKCCQAFIDFNYSKLNFSLIYKNIATDFRSNTVFLPISTRGIGFVIRVLVHHISMLGIYDKHHDKSLILYKLTNALYRITLLQLNLKLIEMPHQDFSNSFVSPFDFPLQYEMAKKVCKGKGFKILTGLISAVGCFKKGAKAYIPAIPKVLDEASLNPLFVHFGVLEQMVRKLSDENTDGYFRKFFYEHNPIPGAKWEKCQNNQGYILTNAVDIIPLNYNVRNMIHDTCLISEAILRVEREFPNYISHSINYNGHGSYEQLISLKILPLRCPTYSEKEIMTKNNEERMEGDVWSSEQLTDDKDHKYLLGEIYDDDLWLLNSKCQSIRKQESSCCRAYTGRYLTMLNLQTTK